MLEFYLAAANRQGYRSGRPRYNRFVGRADKGTTESLEKAASSGPVPLSNSYLRAIEQMESLAENQPGSDKAWVESSLQEYRAHYARAVRVR